MMSCVDLRCSYIHVHCNYYNVHVYTPMQFYRYVRGSSRLPNSSIEIEDTRIQMRRWTVRAQMKFDLPKDPQGNELRGLANGKKRSTRRYFARKSYCMYGNVEYKRMRMMCSVNILPQKCWLYRL